jgi:hypothetical protein
MDDFEKMIKYLEPAEDDSDAVLKIKLYQARARLCWQQLSIGEPERKVLCLLKINERLENELRQALCSSWWIRKIWELKSILRVFFERPIARTIYK